MAAAQREVWTGAQLRRLLAERAGLHLSSASVSALLTRQPAQVKLETLAALCTALQCTPDDLIEVDTTPVPQPAARPAPAREEPRAARGPVAAAAVSRYPPCARCGAPVKFRGPGPCHACHRKAARAALKRPCPRCGRVRHLRPAGICAICDRPAGPARPAKTISCGKCGEQRRNAGHGLCNRCKLADPDWPFRYGASLAARLPVSPALVAGADRVRRRPPPSRRRGRDLAPRRPGAAGRRSAGPRQILAAATRPDGTLTRPDAPWTGSSPARALILPGDQAGCRAAARRQRYLDAVPAGLAGAVAAFNDSQLAEQDRARRAGRRPLSDITLETRLRILRDLAGHLAAAAHHQLGRSHHRRPGTAFSPPGRAAVTRTPTCCAATSPGPGSASSS